MGARAEAGTPMRRQRWQDQVVAVEMRRKWIDSGHKAKSAPVELVMDQILG